MRFCQVRACSVFLPALKLKLVLVKSCARRIRAAFRVMARSMAWLPNFVKPSQPHLRANSMEDIACELVNSRNRKHEAKLRLNMLL